jgi:hypothetical protein
MSDAPTVLYHGTTRDHLSGIYSFGLSSEYSAALKGVYLTDDPAIAEYFAERAAEWGGDPVVIAVPFTPELRRGLRADRKMLMQPVGPIEYDLKAADELFRSGTTSWLKSLKAVHSVIYRGSDPIEVTPVMVTNVGERRFNRFPLYRRSTRRREIRVRRHERRVG